jgi:hypothetical protein
MELSNARITCKNAIPLHSTETLGGKEGIAPTHS